MNSIAACARRLLLTCTLLGANALASPAALAQARDEAWVVTQIAAGRFEELRALEQLSDQGIPFALYWWGNLIERCIFERCDASAARALYLRAAKAGHERAQATLFSAAASPDELAALIADIGVPARGRARMLHAMRTVLAPGRSEKARADFIALATSERQLGLLAALVAMEGPAKRADELRAIASSGYVGFSEWVLRSEMLRSTTDAQMLERASAGDLALGAAYCDTAGVRRGEQVLPPDTLAMCERAAGQGYPGAVRALVRHHHHRNDRRAAEYFAGVCDALLGLRCAGDISEHYGERRGESAELAARWELWDLAAANVLAASMSRAGFPGGTSAEELRGKTEQLRRGLYGLIVRTELIDDACLTQRLDPATGAVEAGADCPWRRPIAIPAEFLGK
jgi:hypothetical protein